MYFVIIEQKQSLFKTRLVLKHMHVSLRRRKSREISMFKLILSTAFVVGVYL